MNLKTNPLSRVPNSKSVLASPDAVERVRFVPVPANHDKHCVDLSVFEHVSIDIKLGWAQFEVVNYLGEACAVHSVLSRKCYLER